jgi:hypothetical protein
MIVAKDTATEIVDKIKSIYSLIPFFKTRYKGMESKVANI